MKTLVISPQAGMCNRFRALCSAMLLGGLSDRTVHHNWTVEPPHAKDSGHVRGMREATLSTFFEPSDAIPYLALDSHSPVDAVFSEWGPRESWYSRQCSAIRRCNRHDAVNVERRGADSLLECDADTILLETSLALKPSSMCEEDHDAALAEIFTTHFVPLREYTEISDGVFGCAPFVGLHIRRGDHLKYVPEARTSVSDWVKLISKQIPTGERVFLCSDDDPFAARVATGLPDHDILRLDAEYDSKPTNKAFLEFLCLSRATRIYGTAGSSFSKEAARFGGKPISICQAKPPGLIDRVKSRIGLA